MRSRPAKVVHGVLNADAHEPPITIGLGTDSECALIAGKNGGPTSPMTNSTHVSIDFPLLTQSFMSYENASIERCLEQIELLDFKDPHGYPIKNAAGFIRLVELARCSEPWIATTFQTFNEYKEAHQIESSKKDCWNLKGSVVLGRYVGDKSDIYAYLKSRAVGDICLNKETAPSKVIVVTKQMAEAETARLKRIEELKKELAALEK